MTNGFSQMFVPPPYTVMTGFPDPFEISTLYSPNYIDMAGGMEGVNPSIFMGGNVSQQQQQPPSLVFGALGRLAAGSGNANDENTVKNMYPNPFMSNPTGGMQQFPTNMWGNIPMTGGSAQPMGGNNNAMMYDLNGILQAGYGSYLF